MRVIIKFIYNIFLLIAYNPRVVGKENIPDTGGAIICPNHIHALDSTIIIAKTKRKVNVFAKKELFKNPVINAIAKIFGMHPIDRGSQNVGVVKLALGLMKQNELLMIFPEGTRNGIERGIKPKDGAIKIATKAGVPIIPVGVQGSFKPFRRVIINIGKPINYPNAKISEDESREMLDHLISEIIRLTKEKI